MCTGFTDCVAAAWVTPGVSEFLAALIGGGMTMLAQSLALKHDREKEKVRQIADDLATAWGIFFKLSAANNVITATNSELRKARELANQRGTDLWQTLQPPAHDWDRVICEPTELVFLLKKSQFDILHRYQLATVWMSNLVQSTRTYREMRLEFLMSTPSAMRGTSGSLQVDDTNRNVVMPKIAHLKSLSESMETVVAAQYPQVRQLLLDYSAGMKAMVGVSPQIEIMDEA